ncbi:hypothetical protein V5O48_000690 [Marasmius crinis-equi]|uniref:Uncharacterized protein n=1 Tax=Marasmius crinis-equi TaxID=585013 RepID=A0ABR3G0Q8_9AGAR
MAKAKRTKPPGSLKPGNGPNKQAAAQQAAKKKRKVPDARSMRFKNAALKDSIDSQAHLLYATTVNSVKLSETGTTSTTDRDLAAIMGNL